MLIIEQSRALPAVNWNQPADAYTKMFWDQNVRQFWVDEEIPLADDKLPWMTLLPEEKRTYEHVLGGLTLLDTLQGGVGMPLLSQYIENPQRKAVLGFMGAMEHMHAKSYSSIFTTLCTKERIQEIFDWVNRHPILQQKLAVIRQHYLGVEDPKSLYLGLAASVLLESFLFYSGFFYPLLLAGGGRMVNSGEIINLIIRDEAIHGVYVGLLAQEVAHTLPEHEQNAARRELMALVEALYRLEEVYTRELYHPLGLEEAVLAFVRYNADKALMNLGESPYFRTREEEVSPVVLAGLSTRTKNHDFFSTKGNGYVKAIRVEPLSDEDFRFPEEEFDCKPVIKRDGRVVPFDELRIVRAIEKAETAVGQRIPYEEIQRAIVEPIKALARTQSLAIEEIQDRVEEGLMRLAPAVAKAYILYREERRKERRAL